MARILGCDLGSSSFGWALVDTDRNRLVAQGVRVFPEGVARDQQEGEHSKSEQRRIARMQRRQAQRRARRKRLLREALVEAGLYPSDPNAQKPLDSINPYELRRRALTEPLSPHEIGRVLIHLNQRRGFLSNRKSDRARNEDSKTLASISALEQRIQSEGHTTLGAYLDARTPKPGEPARTPQDETQQVRGLHTRRSMLFDEFDAVWKAQQPHHPDLLTDLLRYGAKGKQQFPAEPDRRTKGKTRRSPLTRYGIEGLIFFQRPLYWLRSVIGKCELVPGKHRCPRADRVAQKARVLMEVNNLRLIDEGGTDRRLTTEERARLLAYLMPSPKRSFDDIRNHLGMIDGVRFNLETLAKGDKKSKGRSALKGIETDALLAKTNVFGKAWHRRSEPEKDAIVRDLLDQKRGDEWLFEKATTEWGLTAEKADNLLDAIGGLPPGYSQFSREALENLLPHLEEGMPLMAGEGRDEYGRPTDALHAAGYLRPDERPLELLAQLPEPPDLPNPLVRQALFEFRKVVNAIIREYGTPDEIHIELAREVKGSLEKRRQTRLDQIANERRRDRAAKEIRKHGAKVTGDSIRRYLLWEEQDKICIYSGEPISQAQLLGGEVDVDHILPYSRSLDDSMANKAVCFRRANARKGNRTPWEWLSRDRDAEFDYDHVLQRARKLGHFGKYRKFTAREITLNDFIARQLVDTAYISREVVKYAKQIGKPDATTGQLEQVDVLGTKGRLTADLRLCWGLNQVLRHDLLDLKNREDHRHHAVDAIAVALTDPKRLQQLARLRFTGEEVPQPWEGFVNDVRQAVNGIIVSHRADRSVHGPLHEDTFYGPTRDPGVFVSRQPVASLTPAMVPKIRDKRIRKLITSFLQERGVDIGRGKAKIPPKVWSEPIWFNKDKGIQVKKVRVRKDDKSIVPVRGGKDNPVSGAYIKPGSTHHMCIFEFEEKGKKKREAVFVSMLEAARRKQTRQEIIQRQHPDRPEARFVMSLSTGEAVMGLPHDNEIAVFDTVSSTSSQMWFVHHADARVSKEKKKFSKKPNSMSRTVRKVLIDPLGRIRWAND